MGASQPFLAHNAICQVACTRCIVKSASLGIALDDEQYSDEALVSHYESQSTLSITQCIQHDLPVFTSPISWSPPVGTPVLS